MSDGVPLHYKTITEIAKLIESKQVSPVEITSHMLSRIEGLDPRFKSYATVMATALWPQLGMWNKKFRWEPIAAHCTGTQLQSRTYALPKAYAQWGEQSR